MTNSMGTDFYRVEGTIEAGVLASSSPDNKTMAGGPKEFCLTITARGLTDALKVAAHNLRIGEEDFARASVKPVDENGHTLQDQVLLERARLRKIDAERRQRRGARGRKATPRGRGRR